MAPRERRAQLLDAALRVIVEQGYAGVSIEAIARSAGVTRPVIYDHFANLGALLQALIEREEDLALAQIAQVVPDQSMAGSEDPVDLLSVGVGRFLAAVASRPSTWRIILLPTDGTPAIVREHVERNRTLIARRLEGLVRAAVGGSPDLAEADADADAPVGPAGAQAVDTELIARSILALAEEAGRAALIDPVRFSPARYEAFVRHSVRRLATGARPPA